ncbi:MAG: hypothetical protein ACM31C_33690 [Acidobacteriota bacterium]
MRALLVGLALIVACGGARPPPPERPSPPVAAPPATAVAEVAPDEGECDALFAHAVALGASETHSAQLTADDQARVQSDVRARYLASCRAMSRAAYRCAVASASLAALDGCAP